MGKALRRGTMNVMVDSKTCVACGRCATICPIVFEMEGEHAGVKCCPVPSDQEEACLKAVASCLVEAIMVSE